MLATNHCKFEASDFRVVVDDCTKMPIVCDKDSSEMIETGVSMVISKFKDNVTYLK